MMKSTIFQMVGRAGRVGFDTNGVAVIMTSNEDKGFYDMDAMEMETVESTLHNILIEGNFYWQNRSNNHITKIIIALCAEISQTVINTASEAHDWIKNSFYYIRAKKNPRLYGYGTAKNAEELESMVRDSCLR